MTQLHPTRLRAAEYHRTVYQVVPEGDTPFEALLDPGYWAHVAAKLRPMDRIEVEAEDGSYTALLIVRDTGRLFAKVSIIYHRELEQVEVGAAIAIPSNYLAKFCGPILKWCVIRDKDRIKENLGSKEEANAWLRDHLKNVGPVSNPEKAA